MGIPLSMWYENACGELSTIIVFVRSRPRIVRSWKNVRIGGKEKEAYLDVVSLNKNTVLPEKTVSDKPLVWIDNAD